MGKPGQQIKREKEKAARDREIYRLAVVECRHRKEIAAQFGLNEFTVVHLVAEQDRLIRKEFPQEIGRIKQQQTDRLEWIYAEAIQAWERSKQNAESVTTKDVEFGEGKIPAVEKSTTVKGQVGDSAYLDKAMKALEDIRKIWGVDAKSATEGNETNVNINLNQIAIETRADFYGKAIKALPAPAAAASGEDPRVTSPVQGGGVRETVREDGGGIDGDSGGSRADTGRSEGGD